VLAGGGAREEGRRSGGRRLENRKREREEARVEGEMAMGILVIS
jgi:hypothetical protein